MATSGSQAQLPPDDNNWYDEEDVLVTDQAVGLPDVGAFNLYKITPPLKRSEDLDKWSHKVEKILERHNLHNLINKSIPWPSRDPNGQKWKTLSKQVRTWLSSSIDGDLMEEINGRGNPVTFADELIEEIRKHMKDEGHGALKAAMRNFRTISRKQFSSSEEFITSMKATYKTLAGLKSGIPPYYALQTMLMELMEVPELTSFIIVKDNELNAIENPATTIIIIDFHRYSTAIQDYIKFTNADSGIISAAVNNQKRRQPSNLNANSTPRA
ncbi:hypothetical protein PENSOL_c001G08214 [Penicillium solitum]|uniref:Uncharacterized protein n=1 Tax=Penicillium solitum TaxID=60172 RepID=A0A1V6RR55_9EURO|nr:uncharacterized protein PENSOL_c001G08214 [Penicillium solitum]OQE03959.1 hypothetical protein PENSOL_c001G08214 [Penicillium solitum]